MEHKEQRLVSRHELAARLRQLALQWEQGEVVVGGSSAAVPELAELEVALAGDEAAAALEIVVRWSPDAAHRLA